MLPRAQPRCYPAASAALAGKHRCPSQPPRPSGSSSPGWWPGRSSADGEWPPGTP